MSGVRPTSRRITSSTSVIAFELEYGRERSGFDHTRLVHLGSFGQA